MLRVVITDTGTNGVAGKQEESGWRSMCVNLPLCSWFPGPSPGPTQTARGPGALWLWVNEREKDRKRERDMAGMEVGDWGALVSPLWLSLTVRPMHPCPGLWERERERDRKNERKTLAIYTISPSSLLFSGEIPKMNMFLTPSESNRGREKGKRRE